MLNCVCLRMFRGGGEAGRDSIITGRGNGNGEPGSDIGRGCLGSLHTYALGKAMAAIYTDHCMITRYLNESSCF